MPFVPTTPYVNAETALNLTRSILDDCGSVTGLTGNLFADTQPYVFPLLNFGYREVQKECRKRGLELTKKIAYLNGLAPVIGPGQVEEVVVTFTGYNNGSQNYATPCLPVDMLAPLRCWERWSGTLNRFQPMDDVMDSLPSVYQGSFMRVFQWRQNDGLYFVGSTIQEDIKLQYVSSLPILVTTSDLILILDGQDAVANMTAAVFLASRGAPEAPSVLQTAMNCITTLMAPTQQLKQRTNYRRQPYGGYGRRF